MVQNKLTYRQAAPNDLLDVLICGRKEAKTMGRFDAEQDFHFIIIGSPLLFSFTLLHPPEITLKCPIYQNGKKIVKKSLFNTENIKYYIFYRMNRQIYGSNTLSF